MSFEGFSLSVRRCCRCCCSCWRVSCWRWPDEDSAVSYQRRSLAAVDYSTGYSSSSRWWAREWPRCSYADARDSRPDYVPCSRTLRCSRNFANCASYSWNQNVAPHSSTEFPECPTMIGRSKSSSGTRSSLTWTRASCSQPVAGNSIFPTHFLQPPSCRKPYPMLAWIICRRTRIFACYGCPHRHRPSLPWCYVCAVRHRSSTPLVNIASSHACLSRNCPRTSPGSGSPKRGSASPRNLRHSVPDLEWLCLAMAATMSHLYQGWICCGT